MAVVENQLEKKTKKIKKLKRSYKEKAREQVNIALDMVKGLFKQADSMFNTDKKLANTYIKMGLKVARKYKLKIPSDLKRRYCKHCHSFLRQGVNCRVRIGKKTVTYTCLDCKNFLRFPHKKPFRRADVPK